MGGIRTTWLQRLYRGPAHAPRVRRRLVWILCWLGLALAGYVWLFTIPRTAFIHSKESLQAVDIMTRGMAIIKRERQQLGVPVDLALDPQATGMIGVEYSDLTSTMGSLTAKRLSLNPQFAALLVQWLKQAGVQAQDPVAVSLSGSFPALNLATLSACEALGVQPIIISSVGASEYGANIPGLTWLDMERALHAAGIITSQSAYASLGGIVDTGGGIDETGIPVAEEAIRRHGAVYLHEDGTTRLVADIEQRLALYFQKGKPRVFINVGGNVTALGWVSQAALLDNGPLQRVPYTNSKQRGLLFRMMEQGVPTIHLLNIERLSARYGLHQFSPF